jgi:hypothetical protein
MVDEKIEFLNVEIESNESFMSDQLCRAMSASLPSLAYIPVGG